MTGSVAADGQTPVTGNLQMGANRITGLANGIASTDAATVAQVTASTAGLGTMSTQNANNVAITGGAISGTTGAFTTFSASGTATFTSTGAVKIPAGTTGQQPSPTTGMIRYNSTNAQFEGYFASAWGQLGGGATGGGGNQVFNLNDQTVTVDYTIPTGKNASSAGPITIDTGITVTVPTNSTWVIV